MLKECNDIIGKLEKSMLSTKIGMVQDILVRNVQLMKDIENYQTQLDEVIPTTTTTVKTETGNNDNENSNMEIMNNDVGKGRDDNTTAILVSGYVDSVQELNGNLSQVTTL